mgnify:CR=1 FL=1
MTNAYGCTYVKTKWSVMPIVLGYIEVRARSVQMGQIVFMRVEGGPSRIPRICCKDEREERFQEIQDRSRSQNIEMLFWCPGWI